VWMEPGKHLLLNESKYSAAGAHETKYLHFLHPAVVTL
jgi:hypothetical protein